MEPITQASTPEPITINPQQRDALDAMHRFIQSDEKLFILNGSAGTGKTTVINNLCRELSEKEIRFQLAATTGRAAKVLRQKTKQEAKTLHSILYVFDEVKGASSDGKDPWVSEHGQLYLNFGIRSAEHEHLPDVVIVDEASMISHTTITHLHTATFGSGNLLNDLLDYVGE